MSKVGRSCARSGDLSTLQQQSHAATCKNAPPVKAGFPDKGPERLEVPLQAGSISFGSLLLFGAEFTEEDRMTAVSLASHAVVALDNARLHRIVERQALVDGLTGLANRRQCEET